MCLYKFVCVQAQELNRGLRWGCGEELYNTAKATYRGLGISYSCFITKTSLILILQKINENTMLSLLPRLNFLVIK